MTDKDITLNYTGSYFVPEMFSKRKLMGGVGNDIELKERYDGSDINPRSIRFWVFKSDKTIEIWRESHECFRKELSVTDKCYIVAEKGVKGFDFEFAAFTCAVKYEDGHYTLDITEIQDSSLRDDLLKRAVNCEADAFRPTARDCFIEAFTNITRPHGKSIVDGEYEEWLKDMVSLTKESAFLDADPNDEAHVYIRLDTNFADTTESRLCGYDYAAFTHITYVSGQLKTGSGGLFVPLNKKDIRSIVNSNELKIDMREDAFTIVKPEGLCHDLKARFYLKTKVLYRYPQDAEAISKHYPLLYAEMNKQNEPWREIAAMEEAPPPCRLGDKEMYLPCEKLSNKSWWIKKGILHFSGAVGAYVNKRDSKYFYHNSNDKYAVSFVNYEGREYFAVYDEADEPLMRYKKDVYAKYTLNTLVPISELLAKKAERMSLNYKLQYNYYFYTVFYQLTSMPIDTKTFENLYVNS